MTAAEADGDVGASLLEVLVVVAILGVVLVAATTNWNHWSDRRHVTEALDKLEVLLTDARNEARRTQANVEVEIDVPGRRVQTSALGRAVDLPKDLALQVTTAALGNEPNILFLPDGSSSGARLAFTELSGQSHVLEVSWLDGRLRHGRR